MVTLQPRERRLLLIAATVGVVVLGYWFVVEPFMIRRERVRELIQSREALLARQDRLLARRERFLVEERELREEIARRRQRLLPGDKAPLAASELQKLVKTTAQETGVEVRSERTLPTTERGGYLEVPVEVTLSGPIRALVSFLHRLEQAPLLVSLQDVKLRVVSVAQPRDILATLALAGYIQTGGEGAAAMGRSETPRRPGTSP
jgi:type II secretory pathway component PulM